MATFTENTTPTAAEAAMPMEEDENRAPAAEAAKDAKADAATHEVADGKPSDMTRYVG